NRFAVGQRLAERGHAPTSRRNRAAPANENAAHGHLRRIKEAFAPPKPNELLRVYSSRASVGVWTTGNVASGSTFRRVDVGGSHCSLSAIRQTTVSTAPAAPSKWPLLDLVELTGNDRT